MHRPSDGAGALQEGVEQRKLTCKEVAIQKVYCHTKQ